MNIASVPHRPLFLTVLAAGLVAPGWVRAQDLDQPDRSGWYVRLGAATRFNVKAAITAVPLPAGAGVYNDGFVQPDVSGTASGLTWNWGYNSASQVVGDHLMLSRLDGAPNIGRQDLNVGNPLFGGELIGGYHLREFALGKRTARLGFEMGYGYFSNSEGLNLAAAGTATRTTDGFGLNGIVPPIAPYAGSFYGPGPLVNLNPDAASHTVVVSPAAATFQGTLNTTLHNLRLGPVLDVDLSKRLSASFGAGFSSVYADAGLNYVESVTFSNPAIPASGPTRANDALAKWRPGVYAELRLNYQITRLLGVFVGGDFQHNDNMTFGDATHRVSLDLSMTYGLKGGLSFQF